jgi:hypothetical protein
MPGTWRCCQPAQASLAAFFGYAFYDRFWAWRDHIAEVETSYVTPEGANVTSGGMIWIVPAFVFAVLFGLRIYRYAVPINRDSECIRPPQFH